MNSPVKIRVSSSILQLLRDFYYIFEFLKNLTEEVRFAPKNPSWEHRIHFAKVFLPSAYLSYICPSNPACQMFVAGLQ